MNPMARINVIFHTVSGNTFRLAEALAEGIAEVARCDASLLRIEEPMAAAPITMPGIEERHHEFSHIKYATIQDLVDCDGLAIGTPIYWGNMSYATKYFLDSAARLYAVPSPDKPAVVPDFARKPATVFTGGGSGLVHDPAILGVWTTLGVFGMSIVTPGFGAPHISDPSRFDGGSPLGAQVYSRRPGPHPSEVEIDIARAQGRYLAEVTRAWVERDKD
jgi:NAD(P)H dehydrogenase (quinone)